MIVSPLPSQVYLKPVLDLKKLCNLCIKIAKFVFVLKYLPNTFSLPRGMTLITNFEFV